MRKAEKADAHRPGRAGLWPKTLLCQAAAERKALRHRPFSMLVYEIEVLDIKPPGGVEIGVSTPPSFRRDRSEQGACRGALTAASDRA